MRAMERSHADIIRLLVENGANVNVVDKNGDPQILGDRFVKNTSLTWASKNGYTEIARLLIEKNANAPLLIRPAAYSLRPFSTAKLNGVILFSSAKLTFELFSIIMTMNVIIFQSQSQWSTFFFGSSIHMYLHNLFNYYEYPY